LNGASIAKALPDRLVALLTQRIACAFVQADNEGMLSTREAWIMKPNRRFAYVGLLVAGLCTLLPACAKEQPVKGFVLPQGDVARGQEVFVAFNCHGCHDIAGVDLPQRNAKPPFVVELGGKVLKVKDYGELLTAVINPDHGIAPQNKAKLMQAGMDPNQTPMPYFGDIMTVTEMTDLVEFLHAQYTKRAPNYYRGHYYYP
jgi:mono/diheme cytochrome c family protein